MSKLAMELTNTDLFSLLPKGRNSARARRTRKPPPYANSILHQFAKAVHVTFSLRGAYACLRKTHPRLTPRAKSATTIRSLKANPFVFLEFIAFHTSRNLTARLHGLVVSCGGG